MKTIIEAYKEKNRYLEALKPLVEAWNGKVNNKRFMTHIQKSLPNVYIGYNCGFMYFGVYNQGKWNNLHQGSDLITLYDEDYEQDGRIVADKLIAQIDAKIQDNLQEIERMEHDFTHKDELIAEYNALVEKIEAFTKKRSYEFTNKYKYKFHSLIYQCADN